MKVIFLEDVPNVARAGEAKDVADGYGRNYLIPQKLAVLAGAQAMSLVEAQQRKRAKHQAETDAELAKLGEQLEGVEITLKARTGGKERLYGSITSSNIASEMESSLGITVDKRKIELEEPIHQLGSYEVAIKLAKDIIPKIKVTVIEKETE